MDDWNEQIALNNSSDEEDGNVKDNWFDDSADEIEAVPIKTPVIVNPSFATIKQKKMDQLKNETLSKLQKIKSCQQIRDEVEENELKLSKELFNMDINQDSINKLENINKFSQSISKQISKFSGSVFYFELLNEILISTTVHASKEDVTKLTSSLNVVANSKIKVNKTKKRKEKKKIKPKNDIHDDMVYDEYDDFI
ncbi:hypothetical protein A3Q56_03687 [Intoshia linei]|uniref:Uncharacterized protein n=1 Tax=Intoshia linei TaxID=1819745 RepID=A0A177B361_9BILA|nr:hypothetical protein A3Q56_03687 [Intoshia linei]